MDHSLVVCGVVCIVQLSASPSRAESPVEHKVAEVSGSLEDIFGLKYAVTADLGSLPKNTEQPVSLTILNPFKEDIQVGHIETSCSCTEPKLSDSVLPAHGELNIAWTLKTNDLVKAKKSTVIRSAFTIHPRDAGGKAILVRVRFQYAGALDFLDSMTTIGVPNAGVSEFRLPFVYSSPVGLDTLVVLPFEEAEAIEFHLAEQEGNNFLVGRVDAGVVDAGRVSGKLLLHCEKTQKTAEIFLVLSPLAPVFVSPKIATIRMNDDTDYYDASAVIRLNDGNSKNSGRIGSAIIDCQIDQKPVSLTVKHLGGDVYRATYRISKKRLDVLLGEVDGSVVPEAFKIPQTWVIRGPVASHTIKTKLMILR